MGFLAGLVLSLFCRRQRREDLVDLRRYRKGKAMCFQLRILKKAE